MDSSEKKTCYRNIQLPGGFASFPGAREVSSISGSLPDDPGGITCMVRRLNRDIFLIFFNMKVCCVFSLESPR